MKLPKTLPAVLWLAVACPVAIVAVQRALPPTSVQSAAQAPVTAKVVAAANDFLATLNDAERARATFGFTSSQRTGWSNLPTGIFQRNGLRFGDLTARQREAALALMAAALSSQGYRKVMDIMNGDEVLKNKAGGEPEGVREVLHPPEVGDRAAASSSGSMSTTLRCSARRPPRHRG